MIARLSDWLDRHPITGMLLACLVSGAFTAAAMYTVDYLERVLG